MVRGTPMPTLIRQAALLAAIVSSLAVGCRSDGAANGSPCTRAGECASRFCLARTLPDGGLLGRVCVSQCASSAECTGGDVCGRFAFRETPVADSSVTEYESGVPLGEDNEVVRVCRPRITQQCGPGLAACPAGETCVGAPQGVCAQPCSGPLDCPTRYCLRTSCDAPGFCAPKCDESPECPRQYYCDPSAFDFSRSGRCRPYDEADAGFVTCAGPEAGAGDAAADGS